MKRPDDKDHHQSKRKSCDDDEDLCLQISDKSVLDCPICFHPLTIPVFQCCNGHVSCSSCHKQMNRKCPVCSNKKANIRNLVIEKVLESAIIICPYKPFGCTAEANYSTKDSHPDNCNYAPLRCPFNKDCNFMGSPDDLYLHLKQSHGNSLLAFRNGVRYFTMKVVDEFAVFLKEGEDESNGNVFILSRTTMEVQHIEAFNLAPEFTYSLSIDHKVGSFTFVPVNRPWPRVNDVREAVRTADSKLLLQIINHFYDENGVISMCLKIR